MLNGLSRDYWPPLTKHAFARAALAFVVSPVLTAIILFIILITVEMAIVGEVNIGASRTVQVAPIILIGSVIVTLTGGLFAFLVLWTLRLRGKFHYMLTGMIVGASLAALFLFARGEPLHPISITLATVHLGIVMLVFRTIAGIRRIDD